eukprot:Hpha_TRINITY_DN4081_c0_g1::TRINITY_DN4081_c0_g1_i1::g.63724::m.63724
MLAGETRMREPGYGWHSSTPQYRMAALLEEGVMLQSLVDDLALPHAALSGGPRTLASWVLDEAIGLFLRSPLRADFVLLHGVTAAWALREVVELLEEIDAVGAVRAYTVVLLAMYACQGCPPLLSPDALRERHSHIKVVDQDKWREVCAAAAARDTDEHVYKLVAVARERWDELSEADRVAWGWQLYAAARDANDAEKLAFREYEPREGVTGGVPDMLC